MGPGIKHELVVEFYPSFWMCDCIIIIIPSPCDGMLVTQISGTTCMATVTYHSLFAHLK